MYFVTQNPLDIPDKVLAQLGNRVQHALRAFTPRDQKAVKAVAETMRANPALDTEKAIMELAVGEALISFLDEKGTPGITRRAFVVPPASRIGPITPEERRALIDGSIVAGVYEKAVDRVSAFEMLRDRAGGGQAMPEQAMEAAAAVAEPAVETAPPAAPEPAPPVWGQGMPGREIPGQDGFNTVRGPLPPAAAPAAAPMGQGLRIPGAGPAEAGGGVWGGLSSILFGTTGPRGGHHEGAMESLARSAARTVGSTVARELLRGALGTLTGGRGR